ncbi:MAG: M20 aminoacylase family protein [Pseudomonadota bacterium]
MPIINRIGDYHEEMKGWRRHIHANPELMFDCHETADFVVARLKDFGIEQIETGIATSGVVAIVDGQGDGPTIGLRADMDALPMTEVTGLDYASGTPGKMHACGHDGHTTMLLGAAKYLAETRNFKGRVALIFQPAEEGGGGADVMVKEGVLEKHDISEVYALHNLPGLPVGQFETVPGPIMAAVDTLDVTITGTGAHAAYPHEGVDPVICAASMVQNLQSIVSRNVNPMHQVVLSVTQIHTGTVHNVIPDTATVQATVRTFNRETRDMVVARIAEIVNGTATAFGCTAEHSLWDGYPATVNDPAKTDFAAKVAGDIVGADNVSTDAVPSMGAEDFSFMLNERPGAYLFVGNGDSAMLHNTSYNFDDDVSVYGASFFAKIVETAQPVDA